MEQSMSDQLRMSYQPSLLNLTDATFLQGSGSGITLSPEPDGRTIDGFGQDRALASLSPRRAKEMGLLTSGTYGLRGSTLSSSADLASSLVSKYRAKTRCLGSTLFTLTWKVRYTPLRRPIFAVRASGLRISDRDCTSWPTPDAGVFGVGDPNWERRRAEVKDKGINGNGFGLTLGMAATLTNWRSPSASDGEGGVKDPMSEKYANADAPKFKLRDQADLCRTDAPDAGTPAKPFSAMDAERSTVEMASWPSPMAGTPAQNGYNEAGNTDSSRKTVELLTGWKTPNCPRAHDSDNTVGKFYPSKKQQDLVDQVHLTNWATPKTGDCHGNKPHGQGGQGLHTQSALAQLTDSGEMPSGSIAETGNGGLSGQLNPGHSRWLMSLPPIWDVCGIRAADAIRSHRSSKKAKAA
jgi:hypothetical protein